MGRPRTSAPMPTAHQNMQMEGSIGEAKSQTSPVSPWSSGVLVVLAPPVLKRFLDVEMEKKMRTIASRMVLPEKRFQAISVARFSVFLMHQVMFDVLCTKKKPSAAAAQ